MTSPRRQIVDPNVPGFYHCVSRCVRRAFLCGQDAYTGQDFEHRKTWVEQRLLELARWFSVGVYAYAVMSNHLHIVVHIDPATAATWSPEEVARRWVGVFPVCVDGVIDVSNPGQPSFVSNPGQPSFDTVKSWLSQIVTSDCYRSQIVTAPAARMACAGNRAIRRPPTSRGIR